MISNINFMDKIMNKSIVLFFSMLYFAAAAQDETTTDNFSDIALAVMVPSHMENLSSSQLKKLGIKTKQIATRHGLSAMGSQQFVLYPEFDILEFEEADLMETMTVVEAEVTFNIMQADNQLIFHTASITVQGSGSSKKSAINNAIRKINSKSKPLKDFIIEGKQKLRNYYDKQCHSLIEKAVLLAEMQSYEESLSILFSIPDGVCCSYKARETANNVFRAYQNQNCRIWLQKSKAFTANNQYAEALEILSRIDPSSDCAEESIYLLEQLDEMVEVKEREMLDLLQERYHNSLLMETNRMQLMRDVLVTYYENQQPELNQFILIR